MAEVAAGAGAALAVEQIATTTIEAGAAGYVVAQPTMPLHVTYSMIAHADDDSTRRSLARSNHTLTVVGNKAYIFGGDTAHEGLASNDIHAVTVQASEKPDMDYHLIPAMSAIDGGGVPVPRTKHAACAFNSSVAIYGGCDDKGDVIDEGSSIWLFNPEKMEWSLLKPDNSDAGPGPGPRCNAKLFAEGTALILCGGNAGTSDPSSLEVWRFDTDAGTWTQLPFAPVPTSNAALANGELYLISGSDPTSSQLHYLDVSPKANSGWNTITFPTNPIAPGPRARRGGGMLPITTGYGRNYLVYFFGCRENKPSELIDPSADEAREVTQWSDVWTLQLPSSSLEAKPKLSIGEAIKPAKIKDAIRSAVGVGSAKHAWAEAEVKVPSDNQVTQFVERKLHPGPRALFGCDVREGGKSIVFWGGENAKGERVGDGWIMTFE